VKTLDGRLLVVPVDQIIGPKSIIPIEGEGMPVFVDRKQEDNGVGSLPRGNLYIKFDIAFPMALNES
jgi:DnaJ-class molecular chaperone